MSAALSRLSLWFGAAARAKPLPVRGMNGLRAPLSATQGAGVDQALVWVTVALLAWG